MYWYVKPPVTLQEICEREGVSDAWAWVKSQLKLENARESEGRRKVSMSLSPDRIIEKDEQRRFNVGYMILQKLYYELGIGLINDGITRLEFDPTLRLPYNGIRQKPASHYRCHARLGRSTHGYF